MYTRQGIDTRSDEAQVASLRHALAALDFYQGFWHTMQAEWLGVDKFRIDKYYLLMRRFLQAGCQLLLVYGCDALLVERYVHIMRGTDGPLSSNNVHVPDSITYHICDAFLAELDAAVAAHAEASPAVPTIDGLATFIALAAPRRTAPRRASRSRTAWASASPAPPSCRCAARCAWA